MSTAIGHQLMKLVLHDGVGELVDGMEAELRKEFVDSSHKLSE
jgi:hypothetical protein